MDNSKFTMYNTVFGENEHADKLLDILDLKRDSFDRYRDCMLNEDGTKIIVVTRSGICTKVVNTGRIRNGQDANDVVEEYMKSWSKYTELMFNPDLINWSLDPEEETYCYFIFKVPVLYLPQTKPLATGKRPLLVSEKFKLEKKLLDKNDPGAIARAEKLAKRVDEQIANKPNGSVIFIGDYDWVMYGKECGNGN